MCLFPIRIKQKVAGVRQFTDVPCGKCYQCLLSKKYENVLKLHLESLDALEHDKSLFFVTLTLTDEALYRQFTEFSDVPEDQGIRYVFKPLKNFLQSIKYDIKDLRYFIVPELGTKTKRLHFHGIFFTSFPNQHFFDLFERKWKFGYGSIKQVRSIGAFKYVSKYVLKQQKFPHFMSTKPPLGIAFWLRSPFFMKSFLEGKIQVGYQTYDIPKSYYQYVVRNLDKIPDKKAVEFIDANCFTSSVVDGQRCLKFPLPSYDIYKLYCQVDDLVIQRNYPKKRKKNLSYDEKIKLSTLARSLGNLDDAF